MDLTRAIEVSEKNYLSLLEYFFAGEWKDTFLPSHDINHHRRVWRYGRELLACGLPPDPATLFSMVSKTLIACYLHDCGMSVDRGPGHGFHSRILAEKFFRLNSIPESFFSDILPVIENHDKKDYSAEEDQFSPGSVLAVADDLDAFGFTGIYRYSEIYLARGVPYESIGDKVLENASKRFDNFARIYGSSQDLFRKHENRFFILRDFFVEYNHEISPSFSGRSTPHQNIIRSLGDILSKRTPLPLFCISALEGNPDPVTIRFFNGFLNELQEYEF